MAGAREAYDLVYSMTRCEQERYRGFGLETPYVPWGCTRSCSPSKTGARSDIPEGVVQLIFPAGFIGPRKPIEPALEAFERTTNPRLRLLVKAQVERKTTQIAREAAERDPRIDFVLEDQPTDEHLRTFAGADVCLTPARWEGLGLPLFEAMAFGMPVITNDFPPLNEVIEHERNGLHGASIQNGTAQSGIPALRPRRTDSTAAIERLADDGCARGSAAGRARGPRRARWTPHGRRDRRNYRRPPATPAGGVGRVSVSQAFRPIEAISQRRGVRPGRVAKGRRPDFPGAVHLRRHPLRNDAAAADARLASRRRDSRRDPFHRADADPGVEEAPPHAPTSSPTSSFEATAGETSTSTAPSCASGSPRFTRSPQPTRSAPSTSSTPSARARAATATRPRATCKMRLSSGVCPRRASSTSSATAATWRSRSCG